MFSITADSTASIRFSSTQYRENPLRDAHFVQRYLQLFGKPDQKKLSDIKLETLLYKPWHLEPSWLSQIQDRIWLSIRPHDAGIESDGRWLHQNVAEAAFDFFAAVADLLPAEPFIYSSQRGDLVAETKLKGNALTFIVSTTFVMLFAVVHGQPIERKVHGSNQIRKAVKELAALMRG